MESKYVNQEIDEKTIIIEDKHILFYINELCHNPRKCIGPIPTKYRCNTILTNEKNFRNYYCWNCLYNHAISKGSRAAKEIAEHL